MVESDIIEPVQKPTDQVNGLAPVENPNGKNPGMSPPQTFDPLNHKSPICQGHLVFQK